MKKWGWLSCCEKIIRMFCITKYRPQFFTNEYGFITDYLSEFLREMRRLSFGDAFEQKPRVKARDESRRLES